MTNNERAQRAMFPRALGTFIFFRRWLQAPLYLGLIVAQGVYVVLFIEELIHLVTGVASGMPPLPTGVQGDVKAIGKENIIMLVVLGLIYVVMISNLLIMVIVGGYETFVSRLYLEQHPDQPEWLSHVNAGILKVKLAMALIGISSIHLLKTFINAQNYADRVVLWQVVIHITFLISAVAIAFTDRLTTYPPHGVKAEDHS
jgi:uncharacterized protein (TIGR00645 family)